MGMISWFRCGLRLQERRQSLRPALCVRGQTLRVEMNAVAEQVASVEAVSLRSLKYARHRRNDFLLPCHDGSLSFGGGLWCRVE
jgi:hypothetical protein